jgi:hypothetical protein
VESGVLGEWYIFLTLVFGTDREARISEREAKKASEGWGGDSYHVYYAQDSAAKVLVMKTMWDSIADANEYALAFREYAASRFGNPTSNQGNKFTWQNSDMVTLFVLEETHTFWISGPDSDLIMDIWETLNES